jgi:hypothetical protein
MPRFQILKENLSVLPWWLMQPNPELAAGGPCLAIPGDVYAFLAPPLTPPSNRQARQTRPNTALGSGREIAVNLTSLAGPATAKWINIWSGEKSESTVPGPGVYQFNRPESFGDAPGLLIVRAHR